MVSLCVLLSCRTDETRPLWVHEIVLPTDVSLDDMSEYYESLAKRIQATGGHAETLMRYYEQADPDDEIYFWHVMLALAEREPRREYLELLDFTMKVNRERTEADSDHRADGLIDFHAMILSRYDWHDVAERMLHLLTIDDIAAGVVADQIGFLLENPDSGIHTDLTRVIESLGSVVQTPSLNQNMRLGALRSWYLTGELDAEHCRTLLNEIVADVDPWPMRAVYLREFLDGR